jgi:hypothetical protein
MNTVWFALVASIPIVLNTASERAESPPTAAAQEAADVWIVSTRRLPPGTCGQDGEPDYWRMGADGTWTASDESALWIAAPRPVPLIVFIHGNRWDADRAAAEGLAFWEQLRDLAPQARFRLVIWSWPADRIARRNRPDLVVKHYRSREEAVYLAQFLNRVASEVPVSLIGYSYGAQTIIGALRLLAGDCFGGVRLERREPPRQAPLTAVLVAGAVESHALAEAAPQLSPLGEVSRILVTRNQCDPYLRFYPLLYKRGGPPAIGLVGPSCLDPESPDARKIEVLEVTWEVGKRHDWECYRQSPSFVSRLPEYTFLRSASE